MSHARIQFDLYRYNDGTLHLFFEDVLGDVGDTDLIVNEDGTFTLSGYEQDSDDDVLTPVPNIYQFLAGLYMQGEKR